MPLPFTEKRDPGMNAHLHSALQQPRGLPYNLMEQTVCLER